MSLYLSNRKVPQIKRGWVAHQKIHLLITAPTLHTPSWLFIFELFLIAVNKSMFASGLLLAT